MMKITVKTPARLHLGLIDLNGNLGRLYGSIGVAIDRPNVVLEATKSDELEVLGKEPERCEEAVEKFSAFYKIEPNARIDVKECIPVHCGLGSGTQLALAVATALARIHGIKASIRELASAMGRGFISGIGVAAFEKGGFIIDGGLNVVNQTPPHPIFQHSFPSEWVYVVAVPEIRKGLSGKDEKDTFANIVPGPEKYAAEISRLVLMKMLPALIEKDIEAFGYAISEVDKKTGEYYKDTTPQDGACAAIMERMLGAGAQGAGQSSWGPAVYGLAEKESATKLEAAVNDYMREKGINGDVFTTEANNRGVEIEKE